MSRTLDAPRGWRGEPLDPARVERIALELRRHEDALRGKWRDPEEWAAAFEQAWDRSMQARAAVHQPADGAPPSERRPAPVTQHPLTGEPLDPALAERVAFELQRHDARKIADAVLAERDWTPVPPLLTLRQAIDQAPEPPPARIERVLPANGRAVIVAPRKTGKSTVVVNVVKAVTTAGQLFDRWQARQGRVAVLNYEVLAEQWARWCEEAEIPLDDSLVLSLRGMPNPLATARGRTELAAQLRDQGAEVLIVDPFGMASRGIVENENASSDVRHFTAILDELANDAGVTEVLLPVHAGKIGEDARGSSALEDWPDAIWTLVRGDDDARFFYATGRDVDVPEAQLQFNPTNRRLSFTARHANRATAKYHAAADAIVELLGNEPGATVSRIRDHLAEAGHDVGKSGVVGRWLRELAAEGRIVQLPGERNSKAHYLPDDTPEHDR